MKNVLVGTLWLRAECPLRSGNSGRAADRPERSIKACNKWFSNRGLDSLACMIHGVAASPHDQLLVGGCRCERLKYRVIGKPRAVNCCHCRDCQRLTGSAFAINTVYQTPQVELLGSGWSKRDEVTDAGGGRTWRCFDCGVLLFADHPAFGDALRFVRTGTLDMGERLVPDAHYFVRSKHPWVVIPDGLPAWETLPPGEDG